MVQKRTRVKAKEIHTSMIKRIAQITGLFEYQVRQVIMSFIRLTISDLVEGKEVHILSLGRFWLKRMAPSQIWNPYLKKKVKSGNRYIPKFTFGPTATRFVKREAKKHFEGKADREKS